MSVSPAAPKSSHFFSAFHRYVSLPSNVRGHHPRYLKAISVYHQRQASTTSPASRSTVEGASKASAETSEAATSHNQTTHYSLFPSTLPRGPPPSGPFPIDAPTLRREFLQLQARAHPDRHTGANKARAEGTSALINEAYKVLLSPLLRAQYLLHLNGIDVAEDETAKVEDPELLMEVLEAREAIEEAEEEQQLDGLKEVNERRVSASEESLAGLCEKGDWEEAKDEAVRLRYWINIREAINSWEKGKPVVLVH